MSCGIYRILNKSNGKCYVGQSTNIEARWYEHTYELVRNKHHNHHLQRAWNKYGACSFVFEILCLCDKEHLNDLETYWCNYYRPNVYNLGNTGNVGTVSEETRKKMSQIFTGRHVVVTPEQCRERSKRLKGHIVSEETRRKISEAHKGRPTWNKGMKNQYTRPKKSEETKAKIRESVKLNWSKRKNAVVC